MSMNSSHQPINIRRQGSRTPHTDPLARGAFVGLTLSHTRAHMFKAILESVCFGTRSCFEALEAAAAQHDSSDVDIKPEVTIAGGATRSDLWLQLHADISGRTFVINKNTDGPLLGCAILASVGAGIYGSVDEAVKNMVRRERIVEPNPEVSKVYDRLYKEVYLKVRPGVKEIVHTMAKLRGGTIEHSEETKVQESPSRKIHCGKWGMNCLRILRGGGRSVDGVYGPLVVVENEQERGTPILSPSLLAADW